MTNRVHVPFDERWRMQTEPRVSQAVRIGGFSAICGQCDLDSRGRPLHAGELWPQVEAVTRHLFRRLQQAGAPAASVRRLEAFYVGPANEHELRAALVDAVGSQADVLLVPLSDFYYPGMRIELDAICDADDRLVFRTADGDDIDTALAALNVPPDSIRLLRMYRRGRSGSTTDAIPLPELPCPVRVAAIATDVPPPDIIFVGGRLPVDERGEVQHRDDVEAQTRFVMSGVERELRKHDASLADLAKVTVHYVGGPTPEDLHRNLDVRSQHYVPPGPASTGVPVPALQLPGATILIEAIAIKGASDPEPGRR